MKNSEKYYKIPVLDYMMANSKSKNMKPFERETIDIMVRRIISRTQLRLEQAMIIIPKRFIGKFAEVEIFKNEKQDNRINNRIRPQQ